MYKEHHVTVVIPALNEEKAIPRVIKQLKALKYEGLQVVDNVIVCDNGSTDNTAALSEECGAHVVYQAKKGYGIACLTAISAINDTDIVLFVDADDSCFIKQTFDLLNAILGGADLAIGSRRLGNAEEGALTPLQKFGNALSSRLISTLWSHDITDLGPFRAVTYEKLLCLEMQDQRFGWTVEMQVKAIQLGLNVQEVPVDSKVRIGQSKISGTLKGAVGAGIGILSMIARLRLQQRSFLKRQHQQSSSVF